MGAATDPGDASHSARLPDLAGILRWQGVGTRAAFLIAGMVVATWAPIVPHAKARIGLDDAELGTLLLCIGLGSLLAMPIAGALAARHGCRRVMLVAALVMLAVLPLLAVVATPVGLAAVLFAFGASVGALDCAMNIQAVAVERDARRPMMSGFHAFYSVGSLAGAAGATVLLSAGVTPLAVTLAVLTLTAALTAFSARHWRSDRAPRDAAGFAWPKGVVVLIGLVCFTTFLAEGAMLDWSAVFLHEVRGVAMAKAGWGFVVFNLAIALARLVGDHVVGLLGRVKAVLLGGVIGGTGLALATLHPAYEVVLAGYALLGIGCSNIVPVMFSMAGEQTRMPASLAVPAVTTMGYAGVLAGPAMIGWVAQGFSLSMALQMVAVGVTAAAALGAAIAWRGKR